jgi:uncharacterized protein YdhG (YjbR/CyaY superfamily)
MPATSVEDYLAALPKDQRAALQALRRQLLASAPGATELVNYGAPMLRVDGRNLVAYSAAKAHCTLLVMSPAVVAAHKQDLAGFKTATGSVQFTPDRPLPTALVKKLVKARIAEERMRARQA